VGKTFTPRQQNWKWYQDDAAEPTTQLANENVKPTLANDNIIRLRVTTAELGDANGISTTWTLEYSTNDTDFTAFGPSNDWDYANGQATEGNSVAGLKTSDALSNGLYIESATVNYQLGKSDIVEHDFAIQQTANASGNTTYYFRVLIGGTAVPLNSGETHPQVLTAAATSTLSIPNPFDAVGLTEFRDLSIYPYIAPPYTGPRMSRGMKPLRGAQLIQGHPFASNAYLIYLFNELGGGKVSDYSGNGFEGLLTYHDSGVGRPTWEIPGLGFNLVAANNHCIQSGLRPKYGSQFTIQFRVRFDTYRTNVVSFCGKWGAIGDRGINIYLYNGGYYLQVNFTIDGTNAVGGRTADNTFPNTQAWFTLTITYGDGYIRAYRDGIEMVGGTNGTLPKAQTGDVFDSSNVYTVGADGANITYSMYGLMEYFYHFDRCFTAEEVFRLYQDPYQMFQRLSPVRYFDIIVGSDLNINVHDCEPVGEAL
jgi:hypothetical protein